MNDKSCGAQEAELPHRKGEYVMYKSSGICEITDIRTEEFSGSGERAYYVLRSVYDCASVIYVPVDAPSLDVNMRHILTRAEIHAIIDRTEDLGEEWIEDGKERAAHFDTLLASGDRAEILWLVKAISLYRIQAEKNKRKLYAADERILSSAERVIKEEFAFVLGIEREEVIPYIRRRVGDTTAV